MELTNHQTVYWTLFVHEQWQMYIAATAKGLCYVGSQNKPFDELDKWVKSRLPNHIFMQDDTALEPYTAQFADYFQGRRTEFAFPLDFVGTPFQLSVWNALREIGHGQTYSYSDIAARIGKPDAVRAVGTAIGANPVLITVPCHRVIGKNGTLTGYRGGLEMKARLLSLEKDGSPFEGSKQHA
jgi:methylated-DNA-[protein]-cysteine S-methyltransferase